MGRARIRLSVLVIAFCCLVAACADPAPIGMPTEQNVPGTCKVITTAEEMVTSSDVSPAVPCTSGHVFETYALTSVPASITDLPQRPGPELLQAQTADVCPYKPIRAYLGASDLDSPWGISVWPKFPTREEWIRDVRVVTCALVIDSPRVHQVPLNTLPLAEVMLFDDSARVRQCRVAATLADITCDRPHAGERIGSTSVDVSLGGDAAQLALNACTVRISEYTGQPSLPGFVAEYVGLDNGSVECWLTSTKGNVTGTQRGGLVPR